MTTAKRCRCGKVALFEITADLCTPCYVKWWKKGGGYEKHFRAELRKKVDAVSLGTNQKILDLLWAGKSAGEVGLAVGLEIDVVAQIIVDNIEMTGVLRHKARGPAELKK